MGNKAEAFDAEKWALAKSLAWAVKFTSLHPHKNIKKLNFYIDNAAVVKTTYDISPTSGQWIGKHIKRNIDKWLEEDEQRKIIIAWIPAHKGIKRNEAADKLAKAACSKMDTFKKTTRAYTLQTNKEENLREWKDRWLETVRKGRFAWANRRPPAWKPPPHVHKPIKRNVFGRLMQARIGHAHIGEYYRDFNIPEEISCPCGATIQTRMHILSECPLYDEHRHLLHDENQNIIPTDIFGTKKGIERFTEFLSKTNAFANHNQV
jgi:ribonuclease HI